MSQFVESEYNYAIMVGAEHVSLHQAAILHSEAEATSGQQHTTQHGFEPEGSSEPPRGGAVLSPHRQLHKSPREFVDSPRPRKPSNL